MTPKKLKELRRTLKDMRIHPHGRSSAEMQEIASKLGRQMENRGKEPTWVRKNDPSLSPPLSIPNHSKDLKLGTAKSIIDQLISDCDDWEIYLQENENEQDDDPGS